jgi:hypothetical protein
VQPRQNRSTTRPNHVSKPEALRADDPLPNGIGKDIRRLEFEVVSDRSAPIEKVLTVLLP